MRVRLPGRRTAAALTTVALAGATVFAVPGTASAVDVGSPVVINEVYGGGGNSGSQLKQDFVELYNSSSAPVDLSGWSLQYASTSGTSWQRTNLTGSVPAKSYYLIGEAVGAGGTVDLPTPNVTGTIPMSGSGGKVALVNSQSTLSGCAAACSSAAGVVDFVGWGSANDAAGGAPAPGTSNPQSVSRNDQHANTGNNAADFALLNPPTPMTGADDPGTGDPEPVAATIAEIQGTGATSPLNGKTVTTKGVVTAVYPKGGFNAYVLQTPGTGGPIDFTTHTASDAIWVYSPATVARASIGNYLQVTGAVSEYAGTTEITVEGVGDLSRAPGRAAPVKPATTTEYPRNEAQRESLESMLYQPTGPYTVTNTYATNQYGEVGLAFGDKPLLQPTEVGRPGSVEAKEQAAENAARGVVLDDGASTNFLSSAGNSQTPPYISNDKPVRVGAPVTFSKPVIFAVGGSPANPTWRFQPTSQVTPADPAAYPASWANTRTAAPDASLINAKGDAALEVASFNVQNFFTLFGDQRSDCSAYRDREGNPITVNRCTGPNGPRGAWDAENFNRQRDKIVTAINGSGADVVGLMEIENSAVVGESVDRSLATLVEALNAKAGAGTWAFVPSSKDLPATSAMDVINSAIIYRPAAATPVGEARALGTQSGAGQAFDQAREPLAQKFVPAAGGDEFLFVVNHFKSKGSSAGGLGDADTGDGQGASNGTRVREAQALLQWVNTLVDTKSEAVVMVGDYNSYTAEDPMQVFYDAGYVDADSYFGTGKYSYSFSGQSGSLDHALLNKVAADRATGSDTWNINSPESIALNYSRYNYSPTNFYTPDQYAASDHDPVLVGLAAKNAGGGGGGEVPSELTLLNINDFHGRIDANTTKFATTVEQLRAAGGEDRTLFLSAGDNVSASLFASAVQDDKPTLDVLNALDLRASAVGNHEFDKGYADLVNRIMKPASEANPRGGANWDYLGANVYRKGTTEPALPEYSIQQVGGLRVGVIGAVTEETSTLVSPDGIADLEFGDPVDAVNRVAAQLTDGDESNGEADLLVAEYHEGAGAGTPDGATLEQEVAADGAFAKIVNGTSAKVSAIFTGHTHKQYAWDAPVPGEAGKTRPILQTGNYGENVGKVKLNIDPATKQVTGYTAENVARAAAEDLSLPRVAKVKEIVDAALAYAIEIGSQPIGKVTADITTAFSGGSYGADGTWTGGTRDDRGSESTLGNLVANSLVSSLSPADRGGATIGVVNPGGLRDELRYGTDGTITYAQANGVLPFVNNLWTVTLTGTQFKTLLEQQWQTNADGTVPSRSYLQLGLSKNVSYTFDAAAAQGEHITSVTIDGKPLDPQANYRIGTFSFLATGGDNFRVFKEGSNVRDSGLIDRDAWIQYLRDNSPVSPDFGKHSAAATVPTEATAGTELPLQVGALNLTSLGSPKNTTAKVALVAADGTATDLGEYPVTTEVVAGDPRGVKNGQLTAQVPIPATVPAGDYTLTVTAAPSGTVVRRPISVAAGTPQPVPTTTTLTASAPSQVYRPSTPVQFTATVTTADGSPANGTVTLKAGAAEWGSAPVRDGKATIAVPADAAAGVYQVTATFTPAEDANQQESTSEPVKFQVAMALSATTVTAEVVAVDKATKKETKLKSGLVITGTVTIADPSVATADGALNINVNGSKVAELTLVNGTATSEVIPVPKGTATVIATYAPADPANVSRSSSAPLRVPVKK
ncbi:ExeM/NucH family extracellular endonuclease [Nakamurella aerolata]|uniref:ExeM/NucH family extracellular endonuclease n=1 Tax=Nakamurella aerolata TaxID=1656892 RepID=A0A849A4P0_9ACTN|nr:ExeM/NucH family extracellular endonuclease [Nakamurella aerolata]NNG35515.1 ExeM/NucH family extracellular endonuclease [Nakamurella aerolata]